MSDDQHLNALRVYWKAHKAFPSMARLADVLGLSSSGGVFKVIGRLVDAGYLERVDGRIAPTRQFFALPVLGQVRAGLPQPEDQSAGLESVGVEDYLIRHPERTVFCRVRGDSMKDAGMLDGDMLVVERNRPTKPGDIVVAVVDNELTVKHLYPLKGAAGWVLKPANPDYPDIIAHQSLEVLGVVVGVFRRHD
ncbi:LexA repressor [Tepidimonas fonticaldi]|uniref:LexA family transcriptional regulator n=1 Tax=Tepidimonas fonticaldi TaxID=1101373 RepID=A0A1A6DUY6_9BURK|nr:S24 family peptidase [Tepidimonas fonticaldi]OBS30737.1 LexA family transcriptional regulator [Tepidimonas fonticaldi]TSE37632.1 LexA repressor [Tepidimonas fonticaldi]